MKICYVDEAGCTGAMVSATCPIQPALILSGLMIDYSELHRMTEAWLNLKQTFHPNLAPANTTHMGWILPEIKGSEVRKNACDSSRNVRRHAVGFVDKTVKILEDADAKLVGRVWIKGIGKPLNGTSVYTFSIQSIYTVFEAGRKRPVTIHNRLPASCSVFVRVEPLWLNSGSVAGPRSSHD